MTNVINIVSMRNKQYFIPVCDPKQSSSKAFNVLDIPDIMIKPDSDAYYYGIIDDLEIIFQFCNIKQDNSLINTTNYIVTIDDRACFKYLSKNLSWQISCKVTFNLQKK